MSLSIPRPLKWPRHEPKPRSPAPRRACAGEAQQRTPEAAVRNQGRQPEGLRRRRFRGAGGRGRGQDRTRESRGRTAQPRLHPGRGADYRHRQPRAAFGRELRVRAGRAAHHGIADRSYLRYCSASPTKTASGSPARSTRTPGSAPRRTIRGDGEARRRQRIQRGRQAQLHGRARLRQHEHQRSARRAAQSRGLPAPRPVRSRYLERRGAARCDPRAQRAVLEGPKGKFVYVVNAESKAEPRRSSLATGTAKPGS